MFTIAIYNLKGGVGKTSTAVNMAYLAAQANKNTVLWDWDPQAAASWLLGIDKPAENSIALIDGSLPVGRLEVKTAYPRLNCIPADLSLRELDLQLAGKDKARKRVKKLMAPLSEQAAILLLDCPPTLSPGMEYVLAGVDLLLVPMIPSPMSLRAAEQVWQHFQASKKAPTHVLGFFNLVDRRRRVHLETLAAPQNLPFPVLKTLVPVDAAAEFMSTRREPLVHYARAGRAAMAYRELWREIVRFMGRQARRGD